MVGDVERSRRFYEETLGLKVISPDFGGPVFLQVGEARRATADCPDPAAGRGAALPPTEPRDRSTTSASSSPPAV